MKWRFWGVLAGIGLLAALVVAGLAQGNTAVDSAGLGDMVAFQSETQALRGIRPEGWQEAGPGIFTPTNVPRDRTTLIVQSAAGLTQAQAADQLLPQFGLDTLPEPSSTQQIGAFTWTLYEVTLTRLNLRVRFDVGLAADDDRAYMVILQSDAGTDSFSLRDDVFLPVLVSVAPLDGGLSVEAAADDNAVDEQMMP